MKVLTLSIKQKWFDEILAGKKTQEFGEIRPPHGNRYYQYELNGKLYANADLLPSEEDEPGEVNVVPVKYDAIKFLTGAYVGKRPWALVEVKGAQIEYFCDEEGNDIVYEYQGKEYIAAQIIFDLGKVLDKSDY